MNLKKKLATLLTSLTLMTQATACTTSTTEFDTIRGKRDLLDYSAFFRNQEMNMHNLTAEAVGETVYIYEKRYEFYSATPETTIEEIQEHYGIDEYELGRIKSIKETRNFRENEQIKVYRNITYMFSLEELDSHSNYEYHVVQQGETLEDIANQHGVTTETLVRNNNLINEYQIQENQTIRIPKELAKRKY